MKARFLNAALAVFIAAVVSSVVAILAACAVILVRYAIA